jgi:hypothetical protein
LGDCEILCRPGGVEKVLVKKITIENKKELKDLTIKWTER